MIQPKRTYNNGLFDVQEIYSDKGMKILDRRSGEVFDNYEDDPITVPKERFDDYFETTEPVEERKTDGEEEAAKEENNNIENNDGSMIGPS